MTADQRLLAAARDGDVDGVRAALAAGAQVDARDSDGRTALFHAVVVNRLEVAKELVAAGADPNALDDRHDSPFLETGVSGSVEMLHVLLPAAPDMRVVNRYGGVAVIPASERGHVDYVREIVKIGIDVNHVNRLGWTALLECVLLGDGSQPYQDIARVLLAAGANAVIGDKDGVTALQHARLRGYCEIVAILEEHGA